MADGFRFRIPSARHSSGPPGQAAVGATRGSLVAAGATAASDENMAVAIAALLKDQFASTSAAARNSMLRTWMSMHRMAHCRDAEPPPAFPLTEDKLIRIAALFKSAGYKSFDNYLSRAKAEHLALGIESGGEWTPTLDRAARDAARSVSRGVGESGSPPRWT